MSVRMWVYIGFLAALAETAGIQPLTFDRALAAKVRCRFNSSLKD